MRRAEEDKEGAQEGRGRGLKVHKEQVQWAIKMRCAITLE